MQEIAYCGLHCSVCTHRHGGCVGCRAGGGPEQCDKRDCCVENRLDGCWACNSFPCEKGFSDEVWSGLCIGCIEVIKEKGAEEFIRLVQATVGDNYDYGYCRFRTSQEIKRMLCGAESGGGSAS